MGQGSIVTVNCGVGHRYGSDLVLLWLWRRPAALIQPLAWEFPDGTGEALKSTPPKKQEILPGGKWRDNFLNEPLNL